MRRNIVTKIRILKKCCCHSLFTEIILWSSIIIIILAAFFALCFGIGIGYEFAFGKYFGLDYHVSTGYYSYENGTKFEDFSKLCFINDAFCHPNQGFCYWNVWSIFIGCALDTAMFLGAILNVLALIYFVCWILYIIIKNIYGCWTDAVNEVTQEDKVDGIF